MIKISELQAKDVVNVSDGKKLGQVSDLEIDLAHGKIDAIIVPTSAKLFHFFSHDNALIIPWRNVIKIGSDVILVKLGIELENDVFSSNVEHVSYRTPSMNKKN